MGRVVWVRTLSQRTNKSKGTDGELEACRIGQWEAETTPMGKGEVELVWSSLCLAIALPPLSRRTRRPAHTQAPGSQHHPRDPAGYGHVSHFFHLIGTTSSVAARFLYLLFAICLLFDEWNIRYLLSVYYLMSKTSSTLQNYAESRQDTETLPDL